MDVKTAKNVPAMNQFRCGQKCLPNKRVKDRLLRSLAGLDVMVVTGFWVEQLVRV